MKSKKKNIKVPKSAKAKLSDLTPHKDARGGKIAPISPARYDKKRHVYTAYCIN
jgi:hypothetical protein